jgi:hypothetical protein
MKSVSGTNSSAVVEAVLDIKAYGWGVYIQTYEIRFGLQKSAGKWRIRGEHGISYKG